MEQHESPLEILKARYARGEINEEEFERRRHELKKQATNGLVQGGAYGIP